MCSGILAGLVSLDFIDGEKPELGDCLAGHIDAVVTPLPHCFGCFHDRSNLTPGEIAGCHTPAARVSAESRGHGMHNCALQLHQALIGVGAALLQLGHLPFQHAHAATKLVRLVLQLQRTARALQLFPHRKRCHGFRVNQFRMRAKQLLARLSKHSKRVTVSKPKRITPLFKHFRPLNESSDGAMDIGGICNREGRRAKCTSASVIIGQSRQLRRGLAAAVRDLSDERRQSARRAVLRNCGRLKDAAGRKSPTAFLVYRSESRPCACSCLLAGDGLLARVFLLQSERLTPSIFAIKHELAWSNRAGFATASSQTISIAVAHGRPSRQSEAIIFLLVSLWAVLQHLS